MRALAVDPFPCSWMSICLLVRTALRDGLLMCTPCEASTYSLPLKPNARGSSSPVKRLLSIKMVYPPSACGSGIWSESYTSRRRWHVSTCVQSRRRKRAVSSHRQLVGSSGAAGFYRYWRLELRPALAGEKKRRFMP
jgi:hypothetical protein